MKKTANQAPGLASSNQTGLTWNASTIQACGPTEARLVYRC